jgi:ubiquitin-conjugating enzyme E2 Z
MAADPITISKTTLKRLLSDVKHIIQNPLTENGIYYMHDDSDILKGYALIIGPENTPYFGGNYFFEFLFPADYPSSPPLIKYCTNGDNIRFNPNLYTNGKVCVSILNTWRGPQWSACQTISTILLTLCTLLCKDPLLNEPGISIAHRDFEKYTKIIEYKNIEIAILKIVTKAEGVYPMKFDMFYYIVKEQYLKNRDKIVSYLEQKKKDEPKLQHFVTELYGLNTTLEYPKLYDKFMSINIE